MYSCEQCDLELQDWLAFDAHLKSSAAHATCPRCSKGFQSSTIYDQHIRDAKRHSSKHKKRMSRPEVYSGVPSHLIKPVFEKALNIRFQHPNVEALIRATRTRLDTEIVSAILEAALRLLPVDETAEGQSLRKLNALEKAAHSAAAEVNFVNRIRDAYGNISDESQQHVAIKEALDLGQQPIRLTPDILFPHPAQIFGLECYWIEYKNYFGFKRNPFVHKKNEAQYERYVQAFGPGLVVYKLGFERQLLRIENVNYARELEVFAWLDNNKVGA